MSLASAAVDRAVPTNTVTIGEVGLAGELRRVPNISQRLSEAARLGFTSAVIPSNHGPAPAGYSSGSGLAVVECGDLRSALAAVRLIPTAARQGHPDLQVVR